MKKNAAGFSLLELLVSVAILIILALIAFLNYMQNVKVTRDATRIEDIQILQTQLEQQKKIVWIYPEPVSATTLLFSGLTIALAGNMTEDIVLWDDPVLQKDPLIGAYYKYGITKNKLAYQLGATLENETKPTALVRGDYVPLAKRILPSLVLSLSLAGNLDLSVAANQKYFVLHNGSLNLPYSTTTGKGVTGANNIDEVLNAPQATFPSSSANTFRSCTDVQINSRSVGSGSYELRNADGSLGYVNCCLSGAILKSCP